jgi:protein ImuB
MQIEAEVAIGRTVGEAWGMATYGDKNDGQGPFHLPVAALRIDLQTSQMLHHLGVETIGQLLQLPREVLPGRFGAELVWRIDQMLGNVQEPLTGLVYRWPVRAEIEFEGMVDSLETIWLAIKELIGRIVARLARLGAGARQVEVEFVRPYGGPLRKTILLSRASRDGANLFNLLRCASENLESDDGFVGIRLTVPNFEKLGEEQIRLFDGQMQAGEEELSHLIELLSVRLGREAMMRPQLAESHLPEKAYVLGVTGLCLESRDVPMKSRKKDVPVYSDDFCKSDAARPLCLLDRPVEICVIASPSHEGEGRPVSFSLGGIVHRIVHAAGPERIAGIWWEGQDKERDYFDAEDQRGRRFWIFRVRQTGRWFLHGVFE